MIRAVIAAGTRDCAAGGPLPPAMGGAACELPRPRGIDILGEEIPPCTPTASGHRRHTEARAGFRRAGPPAMGTRAATALILGARAAPGQRMPRPKENREEEETGVRR